MKKLIALILTLALVLSVSGCGKKEPAPDPDAEASPVVTEPPTETPDATETPDEAEETAEPSAEPTPVPTPAPTPSPAPAVTPAKTADELTELMNAILTGTDPVNSGTVMELPKDNDNYQYNLYIDYVEGYECVTYAPMIGSVAYFVALLSVPSDVDVAALAATIESGADPNKWICVSADAVDVLVNGNVILFYMIDTGVYGSTVDTLASNFENAAV